MEKTLHIFLLLFLLFLSHLNFAQFGVEEYHQEDGIPTDLVKALAMDDKGYIWIATDGGVVKFEGNDFIPIENIERTSNYYKNLLFTKKFGFIAASDDGLISISKNREHYFGEFTKNTMEIINWPDDKYSKSLFEASDSSLWIANNTGILHLTSDTIVSVLLPSYCHTNHYVRNHQFIEMDKQIYVISQFGYMFKIHNKTHELIPIPWEFDGTEVFAAERFDSNQVLIGNTNGLILLSFDEKGALLSTCDLKFPYTVSEIYSKKQMLYLGTWSQGVFTATISNSTLEYKHITETEQNTINDIFIDRQNQLWIATNFGLLHIRNRIFTDVFNEITNNYIQDIQMANNDIMYFTDGWTVIKTNLLNQKAEPVYWLRNDLILQIIKKDHQLWLATNSGKILILENNKIVETLDFSESGLGIYDMQLDKFNRVWFLQNPHLQTLFRINTDRTLSKFELDREKDRYFRTIEIDGEGDLFIGGRGIDSYLFRFDYLNEQLINLSHPIAGLKKNIFEVNDIAFSKNGRLVLGTSEGIWERDVKNTFRIDQLHMNLENVPSVCFDASERIWFVNSNGLNLYDGKQFTAFNNNDGLPSTTNSPRNILIDRFDKLWIGTNLGIAMGTIQFDNLKSPMPDIKFIESGSTTYPTDKKSEFLEGNQIRIAFSTPLYPSKYTLYEYNLSLTESENNDWINIKKNPEELVLEQLNFGKYTLKIRAKGKGFYDWSNPLIYQFEVYKRWYNRLWVMSLLYLGIIVSILIYLYVSRKKTESEKRKLELIIDSRTKALVDQNEELKILNENLTQAKQKADAAIKAKDRFFSIVAHDLKSPFNTLIGFSELLVNNRDVLPEESIQELFEEMLRTSENTYKLLQNLLDWSRSQTGNMTIDRKKIIVKELIQEVLDTILPTARQKNIQIEVKQPDELIIWADIALISTALRNIISNAVKFSYSDGYIQIEAKTFNKHWTEITICDFGVGIDEERIPHLFSIDKNISTLGTASEKGTGLGLILSKEFIDRCNGTITVTSQKNSGTLFTIKLPAVEQFEKEAN